MAAAEHYDNTGTAAFELAAGEDDYGIWVAGRLMPGLDEMTEHRARGTVFSGDWRTIRGSLELVAALGVNTGGFPVPRVRVASGAPVALVAAGVPHAPVADRVAVTLESTPFQQKDVTVLLEWVNGQRLAQETDRLWVDIAAGTEGAAAEALQDLQNLLDGILTEPDGT